jgi:hypothetical protein
MTGSALKRLDDPDFSNYTLADLENEVFEEMARARRVGWAAMQHACRAGEMLIEIKSRLKHGQWEDWMALNWGDRDPTTLRLYMRVAEHWGWLSRAKRECDPDLPMSLSEARRLLKRGLGDQMDETEVANARHVARVAKIRKTQVTRWRRAERDVAGLLAARRALTAEQVLRVVAKALGLRRPRLKSHEKDTSREG